MFKTPTFESKLKTSLKKFKANASSEFTALISQGLVIDGDLVIEMNTTLILEGHVNGNIKIHKNGTSTKPFVLTINKTGFVGGTVEAGTVIIDGAKLTTSITADNIVLMNGAVVEGDLAYGSLTFEAGCTIMGRLSKKEVKVHEHEFH